MTFVTHKRRGRLIPINFAAQYQTATKFSAAPAEQSTVIAVLYVILCSGLMSFADKPAAGKGRSRSRCLIREKEYAGWCDEVGAPLSNSVALPVPYRSSGCVGAVLAVPPQAWTQP